MKRFLALCLVALTLFAALPALAETAETEETEETSAASVTPAPSYTPDELLQQWYQLGDQLRAYGVYPFVELRKGDTGYDVQALQTRLAALGFYTKKVVDNFGAGTYNALRLFEKANGLAVNGVASVEDQQVLFGSNAVAYTAGSSSSVNSNKTSTKPSSNKADATSGATSK